MDSLNYSRKHFGRGVTKTFINLDSPKHNMKGKEGKRREVWAQEGSWDLDVIGSM